MSLVTVGDLLRGEAVSPTSGYRLLAGGAGLDREVSWPAIARPGSPIFPTIKAGELALASASALQQLDPPADLGVLITGLAERGAAGLMLRGPLTPEAEALGILVAERHSIPLLLSDAPQLHDIERDVAAFVRERRDAFYSRAAHLQEMQFHFAEAAQNGRGAPLDRLVEALTVVAGAPAVLTGLPPALEPRYVARQGNSESLLSDWKALSACALASWLAPGGLSGARAAEPPVLALQAAPGRTLLVAPVLVSERPVAAMLLAVADPLSGLDTLTLSRAAGIAALEQARGRAATAATGSNEQRLRTELLTDMLNHTPGRPDDALRARAQTLGIEIAPAYAVALVSPSPPGVESSTAAMIPGLRESGALCLAFGGCLAVLWPVAEAQKAPERFTGLAEEIRARVASGGVAAVSGVGRAYPGIGGAAASRHEAEGALWAAHRLFGGGRTCLYSELGIYRLLLPLRDTHSAELQALYDETLGALAGESTGNRLLDTLEAFLTQGGNHRATAEALYLHRNTLRYRLDRISDITGLDLDDPAVRLQAQLALHIRRLLQG